MTLLNLFQSVFARTLARTDQLGKLCFSHTTSRMLWSFSWDEKHVKVASLGCTDVEISVALMLYTQATQSISSGYICANCISLPCSSGFTESQSELDGSRPFLTGLRLNFRYITSFLLEILHTCEQGAKHF